MVYRLFEECCYPEAIEKLKQQEIKQLWDLAYTYKELGYAYSFMDDKELSKSSYQQSNYYANKLLTTTVNQSDVYQFIARNYELMKEYDEALRIYKLESKSYGMIDETSDLDLQRKKARVFFLIGLMYEYLGNEEMALMAFRKVYTMRDRIYQETKSNKDLEEWLSIRSALGIFKKDEE